MSSTNLVLANSLGKQAPLRWKKKIKFILLTREWGLFDENGTGHGSINNKLTKAFETVDGSLGDFNMVFVVTAVALQYRA